MDARVNRLVDMEAAHAREVCIRPNRHYAGLVRGVGFGTDSCPSGSLARYPDGVTDP